MSPILADSIDVPMVLGAGLIVLIPLLIFEVLVEALILKQIWKQPYGQLCNFSFYANCWSLLAGIPTAIFNSIIYWLLVPGDIPGFFARYPLAAIVASIVYFGVTILVEGAYAFRWRRIKQLQISSRMIWRGTLLANIATYAVVAPLDYYASKPPNEIREFTSNTRWTAHPAETVLFIDSANHFLKSIQLDGSNPKTIVPAPMNDYLVSPDLNLCLFRGTNQDLYLYRREPARTNLVWKTDEQYFMAQVAFSPSGNRVAFASVDQNAIDVMDVTTGMKKHLPFLQGFSERGLSVAWSLNESELFVAGFKERLRVAINIAPDGDYKISELPGTNAPEVLRCYLQAGESRFYGGAIWGQSHQQDECGDLEASSWPGLDSGLVIRRQTGKPHDWVIAVAVRPGWLHLSGFQFGDVVFIEDCNECLFHANGYIYLLDINKKRLGTLTEGGQFILMSSRYEKKL